MPLSCHSSHDQEKLKLNISPRFQSKWIRDQIVNWSSSLSRLELPLTAFSSTLEAQHRRGLDRARGSSEGPPVQDPQVPLLPEWSVNAVGLLVLLCRWATHLKGSSSDIAFEMLQAVIMKTIPMCKLYWQASMDAKIDDVLPVEFGKDIISVPIEGHHVQIKGLLDKFPALNSSIRRTGHDMNWPP